MALLLMLLLASCSYDETTKETGHKGKARINPFLAAERFLEEYDYEVVSKPGWPELDGDMSMAVFPASAITAKAYVNDLDDWVYYGGHAVILLDGGESHLNDWNGYGFADTYNLDEFSEAFLEWTDDAGFEFDSFESDSDGRDTKDPTESIVSGGEEYEVFMEAYLQPLNQEGERVMIESRSFGEGRVTFVAEARPFRNRWIGEHDHAELLLAIAESSPYHGSIAFVRNVSLSFWSLLWERAWPAVVALILLVVFWLWKSLPRSGPLDSHESVSDLRAYDHHLEALGDFHWRLDRAQGLLRPLREGILERAQRLALATGNRETDVFELIAERAGVSRERVERAMTYERPKDAGAFTRLIADLQAIHLSIP
ncbi:MAG: DUF4350 domain-containing protein [Verrucomicrobiota bacterium]